MKTFMNKVNTLAVKAAIAGGNLKSKIYSKLVQNSGEGFVDTAIKILMAVVIGALVLAGLYALFGDVVLFSSLNSHDRDCYA